MSRVTLIAYTRARTLSFSGRGILSTYAPSDPLYHDFSAKLTARSSDLVSAISADLSSPTLKKSAVVRDAGFLLRLDKGERARELFLGARTELLRRRARQIKFEGDVSLYISELALVHFTLVKNTSEWYMSAFKDNRMASGGCPSVSFRVCVEHVLTDALRALRVHLVGFVRWASTQVEAYAEMFRRQVYGVDQDPKVVAEALEITRSSAGQLKDVGLDFGFLIK